MLKKYSGFYARPNQNYLEVTSVVPRVGKCFLDEAVKEEFEYFPQETLSVRECSRIMNGEIGGTTQFRVAGEMPAPLDRRRIRWQDRRNV